MKQEQVKMKELKVHEERLEQQVNEDGSEKALG